MDDNGISFGRGLFRLWILGSIVWWLVVGYLAYDALNAPPDGTVMDWGRYAVLALAPFVVFLIVRAVVWVIEGFRGKDA